MSAVAVPADGSAFAICIAVDPALKPVLGKSTVTMPTVGATAGVGKATLIVVFADGRGMLAVSTPLTIVPASSSSIAATGSGL